MESKKRILHVDDESSILSSLRRVLRKEPYELISFESASQALEYLSNQRADVILSDYRMPEMNGVDFLIQSKESCPNATRAILSGYSDMDVILRAINQGDIFKFLTKPWDEKKLKEELRLCLEKNKSNQGA